MIKVTVICSNPLKNPDCSKTIDRMYSGRIKRPTHPPVCFSCKRYRRKIRWADHSKTKLTV